METNNVVENGKENKLLFTPQKILKILSLLCIVLVFCPSFLVSCSGQEIEVNVMTAAGGLSMYGETVSKPYPIMLLCLVIRTTCTAGICGNYSHYRIRQCRKQILQNNSERVGTPRVRNR